MPELEDVLLGPDVGAPGGHEEVADAGVEGREGCLPVFLAFLGAWCVASVGSGHSASSFFSPWSRSLAKDNLALVLSRVGRSLATQKSWCRALSSDGSVTVAILLSWASPAAVSAASLPGRPVWESTQRILRMCTVAPRSTARSSSERIFIRQGLCLEICSLPGALLTLRTSHSEGAESVEAKALHQAASQPPQAHRPCTERQRCPRSQSSTTFTSRR